MNRLNSLRPWSLDRIRDALYRWRKRRLSLANSVLARLPAAVLGVDQAAFAVVGGRECLGQRHHVGPGTRMILAHAMDYEGVRQRGLTATDLPMAVFIDQNLPFFRDGKAFGDRPTHIADAYFTELDRFFTELERQLGLRGRDRRGTDRRLPPLSPGLRGRPVSYIKRLIGGPQPAGHRPSQHRPVLCGDVRQAGLPRRLAIGGRPLCDVFLLSTPSAGNSASTSCRSIGPRRIRLPVASRYRPAILRDLLRSLYQDEGEPRRPLLGNRARRGRFSARGDTSRPHRRSNEAPVARANAPARSPGRVARDWPPRSQGRGRPSRRPRPPAHAGGRGRGWRGRGVERGQGRRVGIAPNPVSLKNAPPVPA